MGVVVEAHRRAGVGLDLSDSALEDRVQGHLGQVARKAEAVGGGEIFRPGLADVLAEIRDGGGLELADDGADLLLHGGVDSVAELVKVAFALGLVAALFEVEIPEARIIQERDTRGGELLASGFSLVRNAEIGREAAKAFALVEGGANRGELLRCGELASEFLEDHAAGGSLGDGAIAGRLGSRAVVGGAVGLVFHGDLG